MTLNEESQVFITCKWRHQLQVLSLDKQFQNVVQARSVTLPFAPQELLLVDQGRALLVADAFGGKIAVVDVVRAELTAVRRLRGHNIRGLAVSADGRQLYVAHQQMTPRALADYEELHWGRMVTNAVQVLSVAEVLEESKQERLVEGWLDVHGGIGGAAADPAGVIAGANGLVAVSLSGVGEVAVRCRGYAKRLTVQARPEALAVEQDRLFVANRFADSLSIIDLVCGEVVTTLALGPKPELTAVDRGERLFYDARLSHEGWISCHSCHSDGHSSELLIDTLGDGDYGAPKRVPSLLGTGDTKPWGWTGTTMSLAEQVRESVTTTMHGKAPTAEQTSDLVAYLKSLSPPPNFQARSPAHARRGAELFESKGCARCHRPPTFTATGTFDVGLADERNRRSFNPPSLRGIRQRSRFFHDGRAVSLTEILRDRRHQLKEPLSERELAALLEYLRGL